MSSIYNGEGKGIEAESGRESPLYWSRCRKLLHCILPGTHFGSVPSLIANALNSLCSTELVWRYSNPLHALTGRTAP
jgi:hypothetical protein